jgi:parvulin-like peptidyl-prolyl isomerase
VNGSPIFADKVLGVLDAALAAAARQNPEGRFRQIAAEQIQKQVGEFVATELEFARAQRRLEPRFESQAKAATIQWRLAQVTAAGGSIEVAKRKAEAEGYEFEERVAEQYRTFMRQLYYQKKEAPRIQVGAADIRRYYQDNLAKEFTEPSKAKFRVIKVDFDRTGGREAALRKIEALRARAAEGKDFGELASEVNDQESFKRPADWIERDAFVVKEVEDAVWALRPGETTDVIEANEAFYLARVEQLQPGRVVPFAEPKVQAKIEATLKAQQFAVIRAGVQQSLLKDAVIREVTPVEVAVDMAMQKYHAWARR